MLILRAVTAAAALFLPTALTAQESLTATIHRDAWGTPHVTSETDRGVLFGMAWALAEDDWPLIEANYLNALGRSAEVKGEPGVADDWMARALGIVPLSIREYENATPRMRGLLDAFAAGMNAWLETQPADGRTLRRIEPWYPLALIRFKYYQMEFLGYAGLSDLWARRLMLGGIAAGPRASVEPPPATDRDPAHVPPALSHVASDDARYLEAQFDRAGVRPRGSNQWAVAPSRTADGHALLLINPHQSFVGVQRYAEIHIDSREGLRFSGLTVFGFLLPYMGNNDRLGWAYTDNYADHSDLYAETFEDAGSSLRYRYGDGWRTAESRTDTIRVRTEAGLDARAFRFWRTHHGPIVGVADDGRPLAARLARMEEGGWFDQWDAMIRARTLFDFRGAMSMLRVAYMNTMYADVDGNIGYVYASAIPRRFDDIDPSGILDGSDPRTEWQGFHDFGELPQVWNPASGWLLNTNSSPFVAAPELPYSPDDFPRYMIGDESDNARAISSRRLLAALERATFDDFARAAWDSRLSLADDIVPELLAQWDTVRAGGEDLPASLRSGASGVEMLGRAIERLRAWDRTADTASIETTWLVLAAERVGAARRDARRFPWVTSLFDVLRLLEREHGTIVLPWGALNRHQRPLPGAPPALDPARESLAVGGAPGWLGSVFTFNVSGTGRPQPRLGRSGNSFVKVIEFGDTVRAASILNYGQSGDPASPHFFDQARLYARREFKPAWFARDEVERNAVRTYRVGGD